MSEIFEHQLNNNSIEVQNDAKKEKKLNSKDKVAKIDPISLLSKDLFNQINSLEEKDIEEKKESIQDFIQLDETQKESAENDAEEEREYSLEIGKEMDKDIFSFEIFKNDENERNKQTKNIEINNGTLGRFSHPVPYTQKIMNFNSIKNEDSNFNYPIGRFSYDSSHFQKENDNFNTVFNNSFQNQLNFFNNSFTMNGKSGWICPHCKNFNYESKFNYNI